MDPTGTLTAVAVKHCCSVAARTTALDLSSRITESNKPIQILEIKMSFGIGSL